MKFAYTREKLDELYARFRDEKEDAASPMLEPPSLVIHKGQLWDSGLAVIAFRHLGPSRSGEAEVTVTCCPDDEGDEGGVFVFSYFHHEGASSVVWDDKNCQAILRTDEGNLRSNLRSPREARYDILNNVLSLIIFDEVRKIIDNYKRSARPQLLGPGLNEIYPRWKKPRKRA